MPQVRKFQLWADTTEVDQQADAIELDSHGNLWLSESDRIVGLAVAGSFKCVTSEALDPAESTNSAPSVPAPPLDVPAPPVPDEPTEGLSTFTQVPALHA